MTLFAQRFCFFAVLLFLCFSAFRFNDLIFSSIIFTACDLLLFLFFFRNGCPASVTTGWDHLLSLSLLSVSVSFHSMHLSAFFVFLFLMHLSCSNFYTIFARLWSAWFPFRVSVMFPVSVSRIIWFLSGGFPFRPVAYIYRSPWNYFAFRLQGVLFINIAQAFILHQSICFDYFISDRLL